MPPLNTISLDHCTNKHQLHLPNLIPMFLCVFSYSAFSLYNLFCLYCHFPYFPKCYLATDFQIIIAMLMSKHSNEIFYLQPTATGMDWCLLLKPQADSKIFLKPIDILLPHQFCVYFIHSFFYSSLCTTFGAMESGFSHINTCDILDFTQSFLCSDFNMIFASIRVKLFEAHFSED